MFRTHVEKGYNVEVNQGCTLSVEPFQSLLEQRTMDLCHMVRDLYTPSCLHYVLSCNECIVFKI